MCRTQEVAVAPPASPARWHNGCKSVVTRALVTASSVSHEADKFDSPRALVQLGGDYLINHVLLALFNAETKEAIVLIGQVTCTAWH